MANLGTVAWLKGASAVLIGFGFLIALAAVPATAGPTAFLIDLVFWPVDGAEGLAGSDMRLLCAIVGGLFVGWGMAMWLVATRLYPREPALARTIILTSVSAWFIVDSIGSVAAGAPLNAALNVGFLLAFVLPLWRPVRTVPG